MRQGELALDVHRRGVRQPQLVFKREAGGGPAGGLRGVWVEVLGPDCTRRRVVVVAGDADVGIGVQ